MTKDRVAIIGYGYVGKAMQMIFPDAVLFDPSFYKDGIDCRANALSNPDGTPMTSDQTRDYINTTCSLAIICVPTPMTDQPNEQGFFKADTSIVEDCVKWLNTPLILIKSTIPPGTTDLLSQYKNKPICFSPEYIGEGKYQITPWKYMSPVDPTLHDFVIIGGETPAAEAIANIFLAKLGPEKIYYLCSAVEAEIIKYMENSWGALKVIFANQYYQLCKKLGASYVKVREGWALDNRVERMHTAVFPGKQGFGGKCYPKDLNAIAVKAREVGTPLTLIEEIVNYNNKINDK